MNHGDYVAWLGEFGEAAHRVLKQNGSFVLDLGALIGRLKWVCISRKLPERVAHRKMIVELHPGFERFREKHSRTAWDI
jgi:hypothetical protein